MKNASLKDVADLAGVTKGTASQVLNNAPEIVKFGDECIERVRKAAEELDYSPNYHARSLRQKRSNTIGFMLGLETSVEWHPFWVTIMGGIIVGARELGYGFHLIGVKDKERPLETGMKLLSEKMVDALIVPPFLGIMSDGLDLDSPLFKRIIMVQRRQEKFFPAVNLDPEPGMIAAAEHCLELGHRDFLWVGIDIPGTAREKALKETVENSGGTLQSVYIPDETDWPVEDAWAARREHAAAAFLDYLEQGGKATAVFGYKEAIASGVYQAALEKGLRIPDDISVVGFDNMQAMYAVPPMSTVDHRIFEIGRQAASLAVDLAKGKKPDLGEENILYVPSTFVERESTSRAKRGGH